MYGDTILAAPHTMTGSIGVITGWFYDKGFKDKIGLSTDLVKRGHFADFGYGIWLPFVNISLADRPLREEEYKILETRSAKVYEEFLRKVAEGRGMEYEKVKSYAGGRVWSGQDSAGIGLIDGMAVWPMPSGWPRKKPAWRREKRSGSLSTRPWAGLVQRR